MANNGSQLMKNELQASASVIDRMASDADFIAVLSSVAYAWVTSLKAGGKIMLAGNGGSAGDAQHVAGELVNRFNYDRPSLAGLALSTDTSVLTCIGNDSSFNDVFVRQIDALGKKEDVFCAISTSGNSGNILAAIEAARVKDILVIGFTGATGGKMKDLCDICVHIPNDSTPRIQEGHLCSYHCICTIVEQAMFPRS